MILGERIKRIRTFRGLTQRELGLKLGYEERNADVRVAQYESGYRVPKKDTLMEIARILNVNYINFIIEAPGCAEDIMQTFFWLDEDNRNTFHLFQLVRNPGKCNVSDDKSVRYNDSDEWPAHAPVGMWIDYGLVNEFLREWGLRKEQLKSGEISEDEYFEWKINWPASSSSVDEKGNSQTNALYMFARSLALTCAAVIPVCRNAPTILFVATMAMLIVQIVDCIIGIVIKSKMRTVGPFIMAVCHAVCLLLSI